MMIPPVSLSFTTIGDGNRFFELDACGMIYKKKITAFK